MSTYTQYTGTFTKKDGTPRTMTFIKITDLPDGMVSESQSATVSRSLVTRNSEVVYDVNARGFRTFNHETLTGNISIKTIGYSFDNK